MVEEKIFANISGLKYKEIEKNFPNLNFEEILEKRIKYYRKKPFKERIKLIWIEKRFISFVT